MIFIETPVFTARLRQVLTDDEYRLLQAELARRPHAGSLIPGGQGLRKIRWGVQDRGKSGGARIIYYWITKENQIFMIYAFKKSEREDLSKEQLKMLARYGRGGLL